MKKQAGTWRGREIPLNRNGGKGKVAQTTVKKGKQNLRGEVGSEKTRRRKKGRGRWCAFWLGGKKRMTEILRKHVVS